MTDEVSKVKEEFENEEESAPIEEVTTAPEKPSALSSDDAEMIYEFLSVNGKATMQTVAHECALEEADTLQCLKALVAAGLVASHKTGNKFTYVANVR